TVGVFSAKEDDRELLLYSACLGAMSLRSFSSATRIFGRVVIVGRHPSRNDAGLVVTGAEPFRLESRARDIAVRQPPGRAGGIAPARSWRCLGPPSGRWREGDGRPLYRPHF